MTAGSDPFGSTPLGSSLMSGDEPTSLGEAEAITNTTVSVTFVNVDMEDPAVLQPGNYTIDNGIVVLFVVQDGINGVRLITTPLTEGLLYTVTYDGMVAPFVGIGEANMYAVSGLRVRTHGQGRRLDLFWTNPTNPAAQWVKILRRQKNWVFNFEDPHDVVYDGPAIEEFFDTGVVMPVSALSVQADEGATSITMANAAGLQVGDFIRIDHLKGEPYYEIREVTGVAGNIVSFNEPLNHTYEVANSRAGKSSPLREQTYYYYTVVVSDIYNPVVPDPYLRSMLFSFTNESNGVGLSIRVMNSKEDFFWRETPAYFRSLDEEEGGGYLDKVYDVMGNWLNIMRGHAEALVLQADDDQTPFYSLDAKCRSLGVTPEGLSYDYEIPRRMLLSLTNVIKRRGSCEGIVRAVRMLTKWDAVCVEFGVDTCNRGPSPLGTWDGISHADHNVDDSVVLGNLSLVDSSKSWEESKWKNGMLIGAIGDVACVDDNTEDSLTLKEQPTVATFAAASAGDTSIDISSDADLIIPGITLQLIDAEDTSVAEIVEVEEMTHGSGVVTLSLAGPLRNDYSEGGAVCIGKSMIRAEYLSSGEWDEEDSLYVLERPTAMWVTNQWVGYKILTADNQLLEVVSNTQTKIYVDASSQPDDGLFAIAKDFTTDSDFDGRVPHVGYSVYNGTHSFVFEPTKDLEARGTVYDPFNRLWMGPGASIQGAWGPGDVGVYITTDVTQHLGRLVAISGNVLTVDPSRPPLVPNALAGMYLNPNQNQNQLFRILSNTDSQIVVADNIEPYFVKGQVYYVLKPRDAARLRALNSRLGHPTREFANLDIDVRILFGY